MLWPWLKQLHIALALITACGFVLRGCWMLADSRRLHTRWARVLPHVIDTLLLASGVAMAIGFAISPLAQPWLGVKLLAVVLYVVLGSIALKRGRTRARRMAALILSLAVLGYIFGVALSHDPRLGY